MKAAVSALLILVLGVAPAWAVLGESAQSVRADQQKFAAPQLRRIDHAGYAVHAMSRADGAMIREYVSPDGKVFGVAWDTPTLPNFQQLLGSYFDQFQAALRANSTGRHRGPVIVQVGDLVVESSGHMRSYHGRAYVTGLIPNGVSQAEVK